MKNIKKFNIKNLVLAFSLLLVSASCDGWIDSDLNVEPDSPSDVPMSLLLPAIQQDMGYNLLGNNSVRTNNIWMQQFDGTDRQSFTEARYQHTPADVNNLWSSIYASELINSKLIIDKAQVEGSESDNFAGVAQVLMATTLGITTDLFGDIPYSEALEGSNNILKPVYDSQESIYNSIFGLLDEAIVNLNSTRNAVSVTGDVTYGGNISQWIKAANSIKARHALQLSNRNGNAAYTQALAAVAGGFTSNADDFYVPFEDQNRNPIFQFMEQRTDVRMSSTFVNALIDADDPRLPFYVAEDDNGDYTGSDPGTQNNNASKPGDYVAAFDAPTYLMTYSELKFIEAEALLMTGGAGAQAAYEAAVAASVLRVTGSANTAWLDANINGVAVTMATLMEQKYIDSFGTNQAYADWRRTGMPTIDIVPGAVIPNIPTRFPYPQGELDYNGDNVPSFTISDKLWWDN
jgi:hypothetical protein